MSDKYRIDSEKIRFHPKRVAQLLEADDWVKSREVYPIYVEVSPIGACNQRCQFCAVDYLGYQPDRLDFKRYYLNIHQMAQLGVKSVMFAGEGEPLLHSSIDDMIEMTTDYGISVAITTNGTLLHKLDNIHKCEWIKVSLNAGTKTTYAKIHGTREKDFDIVLANLADAVQRKGNCTIGAQMVLLPENHHEVETLRQITKDLGLDYLVIKPYSQHNKSLNRMETFKPDNAPDGVIFRSEAFNADALKFDKCHATPNIWAYIQSNGDVYSCSAYIGDDRFKLGNINQESFKSIWQGDKRRINRAYVMNELNINECRVNCRMARANEYLDQIINEKVPHANFI